MDSHASAHGTGSSLLGLLADGETHPGSALAERLGISCADVRHQVQQLHALGARVSTQRGRGYRLAAPLELLGQAAIGAAAGPMAGPIAIHWQLDSTNAELGRRAAAGAADRQACLAEVQVHGRGRRGRSWRMPLGSGLALSVLRRFDASMGSLAGLSLVAGLALVAALEDCGITGSGLKWPNDVLLDGGKLAGVLIDLGGAARGPCHAVIGVGVNIAAAPQGVDQRVACLADRGGLPLSRNHLAGRLLARLHAHVDRFARDGFGVFTADYARHDVLGGKPLTIHWPDRRVDGTGAGVDHRGALLVDVAGARVAIDSGEVSIRAR